MSITAARLGSSPLTLDWSGLGPLSPEKSALESAWKKLYARFDSGEIGFFRAPTTEEISQVAESRALAEKVLASGLTDCLFLGIGGSSLGPISLLAALRESCRTTVRFHFLENPDPIEWKLTIRNLDPARTLVCCVTKSGTTFETVAQFLCALEWLGQARWKTQVVAITDPEKGDLKAFAKDQGLPTLHIHPSLGGRFSIFSPVGLFAASLAGLNTDDFLKGAQQISEHVEKAPLEKSPIMLLAQEFLRQYERRNIHVCMPYSTQLRIFGDWFVQLWGESLGKDRKGFTPIAAVGATDQHSILQLLRDGPDDKITMFITVDRVPDEVTIPKVFAGMEVSRYPSFALLQGHTLHHLLQVEKNAISRVLSRANRPHLTIQLDRLDERNLGALYFAFSLLTAMTGTLWNVNPFDQPGVEEGKVYIRDSLAAERVQRQDEDNPHSPVARLRRNTSD